jgi:hypothetical protein
MLKGKSAILGFWCMAPGCTRPAQQRHHYWSKSFLRGQPYEWVEVDGVLVANSAGLCIAHHAEVTGDTGGHQAHVRWNPGLQILEWWEKNHDEEWECLGPMKDQDGPMVREAAVERKTKILEALERLKRAERRRRRCRSKTKAWTVKVPDDAEDGAAVLDEYVDDLSVALGFGDESKGVRRFHVRANVLLWVTQQKPECLADWEEAGKA